MNEEIRNYYLSSIENYRSTVKNVSYYNLTKMFSINILQLIKLLKIPNYKISNSCWVLFTSTNKTFYKIDFSDNYYEEWYYYDENDNVLNYCDSNHYNEWYQYNKDGQEKYFKNSDGLEEWSFYTAGTNVIQTVNIENLETWSHYNEDNDLIYYRDSDGLEEWWDYKNDNKQLVYYKDSNGHETWSTFQDNNLVEYKDSEGEYFRRKYDKKGRLIYTKDKDGRTESFKYED